MGISWEYPYGATQLDPEEAEGLIPPVATLRQVNDAERLNIEKAVRWAKNSRKIRHELLETYTIIELHRRMFGDTWKWAGKFRTTEKNIGVEPWRIQMALREHLADTQVWIEAQAYGSDEILARFYHRLVWIHPFPNGNGRHARIVTDLLARSLNAIPPTWGSNLNDNVRERHIASLRIADQGEFASLIEFLYL